MEFASNGLSGEPFDDFIWDSENKVNFNNQDPSTSPENNNNKHPDGTSNYFSSDLDSASPNVDDGNLVHVTLRHKPKHARGGYETIAKDQMVRVTSGRGKHMQLIVTCGVECDWKTFRVSYVSDVVNPDLLAEPEFAIKIEKMYATQLGHAENLKYQLTADIQLIAHSKVNNRMHLLVELASVDGLTLDARSVPFKTSENSASSVKREPQNKKRKLNGGESAAHSPTVVDVSHLSSAEMVGQSNYANVSPYGHPSHFVHPSSQMMPVNNAQLDAQNAMAIVMPSSLDVHGVVRARGYYQFSDLRLKTNVEEIVDALHAVTRLNGVRYQWRPGVPQTNYRGSGEKVIGLIAQEVQKVFPELVRQERDGYLSVNYTDLIPVMIEALKEMAKHQQDAQGELLALRMTMEDVVVHLSVKKKSKEFEDEEERLTLARLNKYKRMREQVTYELHEKQNVLATVTRFDDRVRLIERQTAHWDEQIEAVKSKKRCNISRRMFILILTLGITVVLAVVLIVVLALVLGPTFGGTTPAASPTPQ